MGRFDDIRARHAAAAQEPLWSDDGAFLRHVLDDVAWLLRVAEAAQELVKSAPGSRHRRRITVGTDRLCELDDALRDGER